MGPVEFRVDEGGVGVEDGEGLGDPVEGGEGGCGDEREGVVAGAGVGEIEGEGGEEDREHEGLAVVEFGVGRPMGIEEVGVAEVGDVGADDEVEADEGEEDAADEWHAHDGAPLRVGG